MNILKAIPTGTGRDSHARSLRLGSTLAAALIALTGATGFAAKWTGLDIVAKHEAVFTAPPRSVPTPGMPDGPLLGNGDVGVVLAGPPEAQAFYLGKNDFWTCTPARAKVVTVGRVELLIPALQGASYRQEQDLARAEVRGTFLHGAIAVRTRSWVDANTNLLLVELKNDGTEPVPVVVRNTPGAAALVPFHVVDNDRSAVVGRELHGGGRWYFDGEIADLVVTNLALPGKGTAQPQKAERFDGQTTWHELQAPRSEKAVSVAAWIKIKSLGKDANYIVSKGDWNQAYSFGLSKGRLRWAINGIYIETERQLETDKWIYVAGTFDGSAMRIYVDSKLSASLGNVEDATAGSFTRKTGSEPASRSAAVATRVLGTDALSFTLKPRNTMTVATAILSDLDAKEFLSAAKKLVADLTPAGVAELQAHHRKWWANFRARSFIEIPDKEIEKRWYAALYVMGSCSRPGKVAPGLWGNWLTTDKPNWQGDFHLNYNFQAPYYIVYASNHMDLSLPFYQALMEWLPQAREFAKKRGWKGAHYPVSIGPWGLCSYSPDLDLGQRSDGANAALNFIWYWQYTQDREWLKSTGYPFLRELADFWEDYLQFKDGRYVDENDAIHEDHYPTDINPVLTLGLLRTLFTNLVSMSETLGVDAGKRVKWRDIIEKLSPFPTQLRGGRTVFRYTEKGLAWWNDNTLGIQHIFPAGAIGLASDPKLLEISRNTIDEMHRWTDYNGFSSWYTACARVGIDPKLILAKMRAECDRHSMPNLVLNYGGGGIESCGGFLAINEMLLQSHDGVLRLFPCWPADQNARFGNLRACGALLVSAEFQGGAVKNVRITSEKGRDCTIVNPWPRRIVQIVRSGLPTHIVKGDRITFATHPGEIIELQAAAAQLQ